MRLSSSVQLPLEDEDVVPTEEIQWNNVAALSDFSSGSRRKRVDSLAKGAPSPLTHELISEWNE